jgi:hypothetical protein
MWLAWPSRFPPKLVLNVKDSTCPSVLLWKKGKLCSQTTQACIKTSPLHDYNVEYYLYSYLCPNRREERQVSYIISQMASWMVSMYCFPKPLHCGSTFYVGICIHIPPLRSSGQSSGFRSWHYQIFLRSSGPGTESTQPREYKWGPTWNKK